MTLAKLLVLGSVFHLIYVWSIFDIYFTSPLVHGISPIYPPIAPAKRLVLFVADGLRADKLYENGMERAPFLKSKIQIGSFGISHTRVPTESRPGHVAIIAGFYEDVAAVTKGWKTNPVNFDSVFNQSRHTWSFGSPDILPMFSYGASDPSKVEMFMYAAEQEDFAKDDASKLDTWVFDHVHQLFNEAKQNSTLSKMLHQDKIVFFLHLLGLDTNGHGHRPYSKEYLDNIRTVDAGIKAIEQLFDTFYNKDGKTAYIMTADHGMSNRGNHGDGDPQNTETPIIAWGSGIAPSATKALDKEDGLLSSWNLNGLNRFDVNQADIAPLMSTLIGVPFPLNSVGKLPIDYLQNTEEYKAQAALGNAKQILAQFVMKEKRKKETEIFFAPFEPLRNHKREVLSIEQHIKNNEFSDAEQKSWLLIDTCLDGLRYYQTYDWLFLRTLVSLGYIGWIVFSSIYILSNHTALGKTPKLKNKFIVNLTEYRLTSLEYPLDLVCIFS